jgi:hypothetical protein
MSAVMVSFFLFPVMARSVLSGLHYIDRLAIKGCGLRSAHIFVEDNGGRSHV